MATVNGLTAERMMELVSEWTQIKARQDALAAQIADLQADYTGQSDIIDEFTGMTLPELMALLEAQQSTVVDLTDQQAALDQTLAENKLIIDGIQQVDVQSLQDQIYSQQQQFDEIPTEFNQPEAPVDGDDPDRALVIGDRWFDTDDGNKEYRWTGTEWVESGLSIPDLSITVQKFKTSSHMIY